MKTFKQKPYFDDYNENKSFYSILARPGFPLQTREFQQIQSILQKQIERLGDHFFANGAKVVDGQLGFDVGIYYVKLASSPTNISELVGQTIKGMDSGALGQIVAVTLAEDDDPATLFVNFVAASEDAAVGCWTPGEKLDASYQIQIANDDDAIGKGSIASINRGVYYINGYFALVQAQTIVLDKYSNHPTYRVGLDVEYSIITPEEDSSLYDNALGSTNYAGPGGHRLKISLNLKKIKLGDIVDTEDFIELGQIQAGKVVSLVTNTTYSELESTLARRTYDESGDYTVRQFRANIREHRNNDRGEWKENTLYLAGDIVKYQQRAYVAVSDGISSYVGPTHTSGREAGGQTGNEFDWEYTTDPKFNNGVYPATGQIVNVEITNPGNGYVTAPIVRFDSSGSSGSGGEATAIISEGKVVSVIIEDQGEGYLDDDVTCTFVGGMSTDGDNCVCYDENGNITDTFVQATAKVYTNAGNKDKFVIGLENGKAYVRGFEIDNNGTSWVPVNKTRDTAIEEHVFLTPSVGSYVRVTNVVGTPPLFNGKLNVVDVYDGIQTSKTSLIGNKIGTCRIKGIEWDNGSQNSSSGIYRLYVYDVELDPNISFMSRVKSFVAQDQSFYCNITPTLTQITGSVSISQGNVEGSGTIFKTELKENDYLLIDGEYYRVDVIESQQAFKTSNYSGSCVNAAAYICTTNIVDSDQAAAVYNLPNQCVKTLLNESSIGSSSAQKIETEFDYTVAAFVSTTTEPAASGNDLIVHCTVSNGIFANPEEADNYILFDESTGNIVSFIANNSGQSTSTLTLTIPNGQILYGSAATFKLYATIRNSGNSYPREKTLKTVTETLTKTNDVQSEKITLGNCDVYKINNVRMYVDCSFDTEQPSGSFIDITDYYDLDDGQTDNYYDYGSLKLKNGYNVPANPITIEYQYFEHSSIGDYFTVDSYTNTLRYEDIPSYNNNSLRNVIDFRRKVDDISPIRMVKRGTEIEVGYQYYMARKDRIVLDYLGNFIDVEGIPSLNPQFKDIPTMSMNLYDCTIKPYVFSLEDISLENIDNKRYTMRDIGRLEQRITNLEEYTTLSLLEQATDSMLIEDQDGLTRYKQGFVVDNFKSNSLLTTTDQNLGCSIDTLNGVCRPTYVQRNIGLTEYVNNATNGYNAYRDANGYKLYGKVFTLPLEKGKEHVVVVEQPLGSRIENINPFAVVTFLGTMSINPSSDDWFESVYLANDVRQVEGNYLATKASLEGTVWDDWQISWVGLSTSSETVFTGSTYRKNWRDDHYVTNDYLSINSTSTRSGLQTTVTSRTDYETVGERILATTNIPYMRSRWLLVRAKNLKPYTRYYPFFDNVPVDYWCTPAARVDYTLTTTVDFDGTSAAGGDGSNQARKIINTPNSYWAERTDRTCLDVGDVITGKTSRMTAVVVGKAKTTSLTNSNQIADTLYVVNIKNSGGGAAAGQSYDSQNNSYGGETFTRGEIIDASSSISGAQGKVVAAQPNQNHIYDGLITNGSGELYFMFWIPDESEIDYSKSSNTNPVIKFTCGTKQFSLSENSKVSDASAVGNYSATGVIQTKQNIVNAVRNAVVSTKTVQQTRVNASQTTLINSTTSQKAVYVDPLAQTFIVGEDGGCFLSKVELFFATKPTGSSALPVTIQIRTVENGMPTGTILPFSTVTLNPDQVKLSSKTVQYTNEFGEVVTAASYDTPTTFEFESPVYVSDAYEYAIVVLSDSIDYNVWIAQIGDTIPGQQTYISKQPYNGVLFKSQNASTWTADQTQDLMFRIYRANFMTSKNGQQMVAGIQFTANQPASDRLMTNPFQTVANSNLVRVWHPNHGLIAGAYAQLEYSNSNTIDTSTELSGAITASTTSQTVYGTGTSFTEQVSENDILYVDDGSGNQVSIGTVAGIVGDSQLTLIKNSTRDIDQQAYYSNNTIPTINGISKNSLIGKHLVVAADRQSYTIALDGTRSNVTGYTGGDYWRSYPVYNYDVICPSVTSQYFTNTNISFAMRGVSGLSGGNLGQVDSGLISIVEGENNEFSSPLAIYNEATRSNKPSMLLTIALTSDNPALSPIVDSDRISAILINNIIDDPTEESTNNAILDIQTIIAPIEDPQENSQVFGYFGGVDSIDITNPGSSVKTAVCVIDPPDGILVSDGGVQATGTCVVENEKIREIIITNSGFGYTKAPRIRITDGTNDTEIANATPNMLFNQIVGLTPDANNAIGNISIGRYLEVRTSDDQISNVYLVTDKTVSGNKNCIYVNTNFDQDGVAESPQDGDGLVMRTYFVSEIAPNGGSVYSKYITKPIKLADTSTMARILFAACVPYDSNIDVYFKGYLNSGLKQYNETPWKKATQITGASKVEALSNTYTDVEYTIENVDAFDVMAVKITFTGASSSRIPKIRDLRVIACV